jgi:death-on-curing protein
MIYIDFSGLCDIYENVVNISGGGSKGILDKGRIEGILEQVKNDDYYPDIENKTSYLFFSLNKYHCFQDGNKRIALAASIQFLNLNGYLFILNRFIREMENISVHVAAGKINKDLLEEIILSIIYEDDYSEELKLKIFEAIS